MHALRRREVRLFLTTFLALYAELLCIRWIPAHVRFVSYFTNFILLASFLGLGAGILSARRPGRRLPLGPVAFAWVLLAVVVLVATTRFELHIQSAGVLYYGASEGGPPPADNVLVLPAAFLLVSLLFACLGRPIGDLLGEIRPPLRAYGLDVGGSLAGIAAFFVLSLTEQPPAIWFGGVLVATLLLVRPRWRDRLLVTVPLLGALVVAGLIGRDNWWSPYYRIGLTPMEGHPQAWVLTVNSIGHQILQTADEKEPFYRVPYELFGDGSFRRALVIGAGSGSDTAVALRHGVGHVDAVEIDPVITRLGRDFHPDRPYSDPRVAVHVDDGRAFLRNSPERYDLIVFALPDSLTLTSQFASLRLESFLFTEESFRDARGHLTDGGVVVLYNFYRETWLLRKLAGMLETSFGHPPYVVSYGGWGRAAVLIDGPDLTTTLAARPDLDRPYAERAGRTAPHLADDPDALGLPAIGDGLLGAGNPAGEADAPPVSAATDDWPFMYLRQPGLPGVYLAGLAMVAVCAVALVFGLAGPGARRGLNGHMFCLGAAFMLLETRSLVTFSLLFGSTWLVNTLVFFAILCAVLVAVLLSARLALRPSPVLYAALLVALLLAYLLPASALLWIEPAALRYLVAGAVAALPIFLANLVFAGSFRLSGEAADLAFASNLLGVMAGGMLEYTALLLGYRQLLLLAAGFYALAAVLWGRRVPGRAVVRPEPVGPALSPSPPLRVGGRVSRPPTRRGGRRR
jgi:hypothetical protein